MSESRLSGLTLSTTLHLSLAGVIALTMALSRRAPEKVEIEVKIIDNPKVAPAQLDLTEQKPAVEKPPEEPARKVFGVSRKAVTSDSPGEGLDIKAGNTVATAPDDLKLKDSDLDSLPIPTDEYLLSRAPELIGDIRPPYPPEAKAQNIEGKVKIEVLIDADGIVRDVKLVSGPGFGMNEAAVEAGRKMRFRPAEAGGKPVAVRIQFTVNFEIDK